MRKQIQTIATGSVHTFSEGFEKIVKTDRQEALEWWRSFEYKTLVAEKYMLGNRQIESLTGREIELIWKAEHGK